MNVIITGASKGLGKAIAEKYAETGNHLFICARNEAQLTATREELIQKYPGSKIETMAIDLSIKKNVSRFGNFCMQYGIPDIVVNNAGQFLPGSVYNEPEGTLEQMMDANLYSAYHLTRILLPKMMEAKRGHIFFMCSIASIAAYPNGGSYSLSKFAMLGLSKNLREEMKPFNIKVTAIIPGAVYTDSWSGSNIKPERIMPAEDIATLVYASSRLSFQTCVEEILFRPLLGDIE